MTDSMIERVARAICNASCGKSIARPGCGYPHCECLGMVENEARAAIAAMREPTPGMTLAALRDGVVSNNLAAPAIRQIAGWRASINAALEGK